MREGEVSMSESDRDGRGEGEGERKEGREGIRDQHSEFGIRGASVANNKSFTSTLEGRRGRGRE